MQLTAEQRTILAAHIRANASPGVVAALATRNDTELTRLYNLASPFVVWRQSVETDEYREGIVWTEVDNLTTGKARIWEWITGNMSLPLSPEKENVRAGIAEAFGASTTTRANLLAIAKRFATVAESVFATGTGTNNTPGKLVVFGDLTTTDVGRALNENP